MTFLTKKSIKDDAKVNVLKDENEFSDKKPPSKTPWIFMGVIVVICAMALQFVMSTLRAKTQPGQSVEKQNAEEVMGARYEKSLSAEASPMIDEEKELLKQKLLTLTEALAKKNKDSNAEKARGSESSSLLSKIKGKVTGRNAEIEKLLRAPAMLSIGASTHANKGQSKQAITTASLEEKINDKLAGMQNDENGNETFLKTVSSQNFATENAIQIERLELKILEGKLIKGVLDTAINSDLPGLIRAHVTQDVYGENGDFALIPNGSRLIGQYRSGKFQNGDVRVYIVWTRLIEPNGISIRLNAAGSDELGRSGMTGEVNTHFMQRFGTSFLMSMLSAGAGTSGVSENEQFNSKSSYRMGMSQAFAKTAGDELNRNGNIPPTIHINQGSEISIMVNNDLSFEAVARELMR